MTAAVVDRTEGGASSRWDVAVGACAVLAVASLAVPATLGYDPWAWLVWGREIGRWALDTTGGPSWKPLPVALATVLAPLGDVAVPVYVVLSRTAALLTVVVVARLSSRFGGPVAGLVAGALLWVTPDGDPRFLRLVLEGHEAPWSAALTAAALLALVDRRPDRALAWTWLLSLLRPEAWPYLLALVVWTWAPVLSTRLVPVAWIDGGTSLRVQATMRWWGVAALASIPVLWFVPDWIGSGSPFHGADAARVAAGESIVGRLGDSLATFAGVVPVPVWVLAAVLVARGWRRSDRRPAALAGLAVAWSALVVAMAAVAGYAAISRFFLPAAAVLVVLAGAAAVELARAVRSGGGRRAVAAASVGLLVAAALVAPRVAGLGDVAAEVADRGRLEADLDRTIDAAGGAEALRTCGAALVTARTLLRSAAAWKLDFPLDDVERAEVDPPAVLILESARAVRLARAAPGTVELATGDRWTIFGARCTPGAGGD